MTQKSQYDPAADPYLICRSLHGEPDTEKWEVEVAWGLAIFFSLITFGILAPIVIPVAIRTTKEYNSQKQNPSIAYLRLPWE